MKRALPWLGLVLVAAVAGASSSRERLSSPPVSASSITTSSGWSSDGGNTTTQQGAVVGVGWAGNDAGILDGGSLRVWGTGEFRGHPGNCCAGGGTHGYVLLGSIDDPEAAIWLLQDGVLPTASNVFAVGNGSSNSVEADAELFFSIQDRVGAHLGPVAVANDLPQFNVDTAMTVGGCSSGPCCTDGGLCVGLGGISTDAGVAVGSDIRMLGLSPSSSTRGATGQGIIWPAVSGNHWEIWGLSNSSLEMGNNNAVYLAMTTSGIVNAPFGLTTAGSLSVAAAGNKGSVALVTGTKAITVLTGAICTCTLSVGTVTPKCAVASTTLTITGTGTDTIVYTCL